MKTTVQVFFLAQFILFSAIAHAQVIGPMGPGIETGARPTFPQDQLLVSYDDGTAASIKQQVRDRYEVTLFQDINGTLEIWMEIEFPLVVEDNDGLPVQLHDLGDLIADIDITNGVGSDHGDPRSKVNGGDFNYSVSAPTSGASGYNGPNTLLPNCTSSYDHIVGQLGNSSPAAPTIVIMDQRFDLRNPETTGHASHADKVAHVIETSANYSGLTVNFINVPIFNESGSANYLSIIQGFKLLEELNITDAIVNFSASMLIHEFDFSLPVKDYIGDVLINNNLLLVSSAGNDGENGHISVFPGGAFTQNEITVAGTQDCFSAPWANTNQNPYQFEIAAEAKDVVVPLTATNWGIENGTSYSAPLVTSALAQLATHYSSFDPNTLINRLMTTADQVQALGFTSSNGNVLNASAATNFGHNLQQQNTGEATAFQSRTGKNVTSTRVSPNPFQDNITIQLPSDIQEEYLTVSLIDQLGRVVFTREIPVLGQKIQVQDPSINAQPAGSYWLQLRGTQFFNTSLLNKN